MKRIVFIVILLSVFCIPVSAVEMQAPEPPASSQEYMPKEPQSFTEGLQIVLKNATEKLLPSIAEASGVCVCVIAAVMFCSIMQGFSVNVKTPLNIVASITVGILLLKPSGSMLQMGVDAVTDMIEYGNLLLPVMTGAMAAQGGTTTAGALYTATMLFGSVLSTAVSKLIVPMIYVYVCLIIACSAVGQDHLTELQKFVKWLITWLLKTVLYVFIGYIGITGAVSGSVDAAAVKATKLTLSGMIPVVGSIISDASETILVSAGVVKLSVRVYGMLVIISVLIGPFLHIGVQYLLLKITGSICAMFGVKSTSRLIVDFSGAMGIVLGMSGTAALIMIVSIMCFMKGIG